MNLIGKSKSNLEKEKRITLTLSSGFEVADIIVWIIWKIRIPIDFDFYSDPWPYHTLFKTGGNVHVFVGLL